MRAVLISWEKNKIFRIEFIRLDKVSAPVQTIRVITVFLRIKLKSTIIRDTRSLTPYSLAFVLI
jgi:hypothetical protein